MLTDRDRIFLISAIGQHPQLAFDLLQERCSGEGQFKEVVRAAIESLQEELVLDVKGQMPFLPGSCSEGRDSELFRVLVRSDDFIKIGRAFARSRYWATTRPHEFEKLLLSYLED